MLVNQRQAARGERPEQQFAGLERLARTAGRDARIRHEMVVPGADEEAAGKADGAAGDGDEILARRGRRGDGARCHARFLCSRRVMRARQAPAGGRSSPRFSRSVGPA
ncbi:hypothetical protein GCM10010994_39570 [Chelatococcus reniformis]|uniref:Uncharacterized protein n=1 Tax=Chelatococcus reniformis TaxID=1494448 RepID=A0A916XK73_9HYPH|nr:hypothetical protein GCM10010994_39570 [Chelatococcus reniformis]